VAVGGSRERLDATIQYRQQYEKAIEILEKSLRQDDDRAGLDQVDVEALVQKLYGLKHYGARLQNICYVTFASYIHS